MRRNVAAGPSCGAALGGAVHGRVRKSGPGAASRHGGRRAGARLIGVRGEMLIVGGAAMALAYNTRRATRDIDAVFEPKATIHQAAQTVATTHGWIRIG